MVTLTLSGSKVAEVVPTSERMRPQLGSLPKMAVLKRLERDTARETSSASASLAAPRVRTWISWLVPSASPMSCRARSWQTLVRASVKTARSGSISEAPELMRITVSLVDMQPSESARLKLRRTASRRAVSRLSGETRASVVMTTSMVASPGASIPAPLAMPPMR